MAVGVVRRTKPLNLVEFWRFGEPSVANATYQLVVHKRSFKLHGLLDFINIDVLFYASNKFYLVRISV